MQPSTQQQFLAERDDGSMEIGNSGRANHYRIVGRHPPRSSGRNACSLPSQWWQRNVPGPPRKSIYLRLYLAHAAVRRSWNVALHSRLRKQTGICRSMTEPNEPIHDRLPFPAHIFSKLNTRRNCVDSFHVFDGLTGLSNWSLPDSIFPRYVGCTHGGFDWFTRQSMCHARYMLLVRSIEAKQTQTQ